MADQDGNGTLYGRIISRDGVLGLIAFLGFVFLMGVVYQGQQDSNVVLEEIKESAEEQTQILKDIRYALREQTGLTFRNRSTYGPELP